MHPVARHSCRVLGFHALRAGARGAVYAGRIRDGFTLLELLGVVTILGLLLAMLAPAVQSVREAARASECRSRLRQLIQATHGFEGSHCAVPPMDLADGWATWAVFLTPYIEASDMYSRWDLHRQYYVQPADAGADLEVFHCPSQIPSMHTTGDIRFYPGSGLRMGPPGWSDFAGVRGTDEMAQDGMFRRSIDRSTGRRASLSSSSPTIEYWNWSLPVTFSDLAIDGMSQTLAYGEKHIANRSGEHTVWNGDDQYAYVRVAGQRFPLVSQGSTTRPTQFGSRHSGVCHFSFADGRVSPLATTIDSQVLQSFAAVGDGGSNAGF